MVVASSAASSIEEIERQHNKAIQLVRQKLPYATAKSQGEIPLAHKACPLYTVLLAEEDRSRLYEPYWTTRGYASVDKLQDLVREGYNQKYSHVVEDDEDDEIDEDSKKNKSNGDGNGKNIRESSRTSKTSSQQRTETTNTKRTNSKRRRNRSANIKSTTNLWDPENAAVNNVAICRPSHDNWGIHKIILFFCDDFLQRTYVFPWWHTRPDIQQAVQPILDVLNIDANSVVRLLLASLPPGGTIPIHEDSGAWVAQTHRVHVPIIVESVDEILFRCGPTAIDMDRIVTSPGHVFEMNNQAKHAVSNCSSDYRVHLILDYIGSGDSPRESMPARMNLAPGEVLVQTRRSIDRWKERGSRPTPSFVIIGAQKAGTTSLYEYMIQHPLITKSKRRETHCFDWRWNDKLKTVNLQRKWCHQFFETEKLYRNPSCLTGDSTPSYLIDSRRVIPRMKKVWNWSVKFLIMLRNPIRRAESHFAMVTSTQGTPAQLKARGSEWRDKSFRQVVMDDLEEMKKYGLIPYWNIENGVFDQKLFVTFSGSEAEDTAWDYYLESIPLNTGSHCLLSRGLYELNLRPWLKAYKRSDFLIVRMERFESEGVSSVMKEVWKHVGVPSYQIEDEHAKNTREYNSFIDADLRAYLTRFYEPHNQRLAEVLGDDDWTNDWTEQEQDENCQQQQS